MSEVEFEHEGHLYLVRRTIAGAGSSVKAQAHADGMQVAEGVRDTARYVHSILGMDDAAFRASVFAEQKQLAAFSDQAPAERRRLVLQLLGITPLDGARDLARKDARSATHTYERLRDMLPDLQRVRAEVTEAVSLATALEWKASELDAALETARIHFEAALRTADRLEGVRQEYERLVAEGRAVRAEHERAVAAAAKLAEELESLEAAANRLASLQADAEGWRDAEARLRRMEAVVSAQAAVAALPPAADPPVPDEEGYEAARSRARHGPGRGVPGAGRARRRPGPAGSGGGRGRTVGRAHRGGRLSVVRAGPGRRLRGGAGPPGGRAGRGRGGAGGGRARPAAGRLRGGRGGRGGQGPAPRPQAGPGGVGRLRDASGPGGRRPSRPWPGPWPPTASRWRRARWRPWRPRSTAAGRRPTSASGSRAASNGGCGP